MRIVTLDVLRFCAAMLVVLYHYVSRPESLAFPVLRDFTKFGYLGVPLFFMISGYVIALSANNRTALQFGVSRFVRLYPALWAGVLFTSLCLVLFANRQPSVRQILANLTLVNEYIGFEDIDGVYWTLKAELKFYACVFLLLLAGVFEKYRYWLSAWLGITALYALSGQPFFMGWFISPAYSSFFIAGIACFLIQVEGKNVFNLSVFFLSMIISAFKAYEQAAGFLAAPGVADRLTAMTIVLIFYGIFFLLCTGKLGLAERRLFIWLGALTYPLYLIHNLAGKAIIDAYASAVPERILIVGAIVLMLLISLAIHVGIEKPLSSPLKAFLLSKLGGHARGQG